MTPETTCCFSGHRPPRLPWGSNEADPRCLALKARLASALAAAYDQGYRHFLCGMAQGTDLYFCQAVLDLRQAHPDVTIEAAVPFAGQADRCPAPGPAGPVRPGNRGPAHLHPRLHGPAKPVHGGPVLPSAGRLRRHPTRGDHEHPGLCHAPGRADRHPPGGGGGPVTHRRSPFPLKHQKQPAANGSGLCTIWDQGPRAYRSRLKILKISL